MFPTKTKYLHPCRQCRGAMDGNERRMYRMYGNYLTLGGGFFCNLILLSSCSSDISPFFKSIYYQLIKINLALFKINCNKAVIPATMCSILQKEENNDNKMAKPFSYKPT